MPKAQVICPLTVGTEWMIFLEPWNISYYFLFWFSNRLIPAVMCQISIINKNWWFIKLMINQPKISQSVTLWETYSKCPKISNTLFHTFFIATDKRGYPHNIFLISQRKHMLWALLEAPLWGASNEYPQHIFHWEIRKVSAVFGWKKCLICSYVFWPKFCFLCSCFLKYLVEW